MKSLIYVSQESRLLSVNDLETLLEGAITKNKLLHITGILFYIEGIFLQYIEGPKNNIDQLYDSITKDKRHHKIKLVNTQTITERKFSDWSMILKTLTLSEAEKILDSKVSNVENFYTTLLSDDKYILSLVNFFWERDKEIL